MGVTISTHNGSKVARDHNVRNPKVVGKEKHIDLNGVSEIWHDEKPQDAYHRLFDGAREKYNAKQKRADRRITDYYRTVCEDKKKHAVYEMIVAVGSRQNPIDDNVGKEILRKFVDGWTERNPNLELIGAYYHADEEGIPHVHIDYIPVAHGYKRGLQIQSALVKALAEQGFEKDGKETAQIQWERSENAHLEKLCNEFGIEVEHPLIADRQHLDTATYKAQQELQEAQRELEKSLDKAWSRWAKEKMSAYDLLDGKLSGVLIEIDEIFKKNAIGFSMSKDELRKLINRVEKIVKKAENLTYKSEHFAFETQNYNQQLNKAIDELASENRRLQSRIKSLEQSEKSLKRMERAVKAFGLTARVEETARQLEQSDRETEQLRNAQRKVRRNDWSL
jgi:hypothetical protein